MVFYNQFSSVFNVYEGEPGPLPCQNNSSFSRRNCIINQISDKFYMVKGSKKLIETLGFLFLWFTGIMYIFFFEIIKSAFSKWATQYI